LCVGGDNKPTRVKKINRTGINPSHVNERPKKQKKKGRLQKGKSQAVENREFSAIFSTTE